MHLLRRTAAVGAPALAAAVAVATPAAAHEAWFVEHPDSYPLDPSALLSPLAVAGAVTAVAVPFTASLALFGTTELVGHLPVYGVLLAFVVLGSAPAAAQVLRRLPGRRVSDAPTPVPATAS